MRHGFRLQGSGFKKDVISALHVKPETWNFKLLRALCSHAFTTRLMILALVVVLLHGCASSQPTRFYQLSSLPVTDTHKGSAADRKRIMIGVGPVEIPAYVDRPQFVTRSGKHVLDLSEFDRWAEPLQTDATRVLVENLSVLLHDRATIVGWDGLMPLDYQVRIDISRFDFEKSGEAFLAARWSIVGKEEREILVSGTSRFRQGGDPQDYASMVSAMSQNVERLSKEIAAGLTPLL